MRKGLFIVIAIMIAAILPIYLFAQGEQMKMKEDGKSCHESMQKPDLEISLKIEKLGIELKLNNIDLEKKKDGIHEQIFKEFLSENPNRKTIDKLAAEMRDVQAGMMSNRHDYLMAVRKLLTADQFKMFMGHQRGMGQGCGMGQGGCMSAEGGGCCMMGQGGMGGCMGGMDGKGGCMMGKGDEGGRGCMGGKEGMGAGRCGGKDMQIIKLKCGSMGCSHTDKSQCTEECLKKCQEIKVIEEKKE